MSDELYELRINGMSEESAKASTRARPDVPELVRYGLKYDVREDQYDIEEHTDGEYVLYDQAAAMIAAEKSRHIDEINDFVLMGMARDEATSRAEAAEAELDQIKAQVPVAYTLVFRQSYGVNAETTFKTFEAAEKYAAHCELPLSSITPLYADPVASEAETIERLRDVLETVANTHANNPSDAMADMPEIDYVRHILWELRKLARAALSGKEPS